MRAWLARSGAALLAEPPEVTAGLLAAAQQARGFGGSAEQQAAWAAQIAALRDALRAAGGHAWTIALEYELLRLEKRADAVLLTDRAILVLEFKTTDASPAAMAEAEDYALDLRDFHAGSRAHPILPVDEAVPAPLEFAQAFDEEHRVRNDRHARPSDRIVGPWDQASCRGRAWCSLQEVSTNFS